MPYKRKRTAAKRKLYKRSRIGSRKNVGGGFVAPYYNCKLKYAANITLESESGTPAVYKFAFNDLFDPDVTAAGHQPMFYDQLAAFYTFYTVYDCTITVRPTVMSEVPSWISISPSETTSPSVATVAEAIENPNSLTRVLVPNTAGRNWPLIKKFNVRRWQGTNQPPDQTSLNASPSNREYLNIIFGPLDESTSVDGQCIVELVYNCRFSGNKSVASS